MEAFSLLRYWTKTNAGAPDNSPTTNADVSTSTATTIVTAVSSQTSETEENDHGPFFDLEFSLPPEEVINAKDSVTTDDEEDCSNRSEEDLKFALVSGSTASDTSTADLNVSGSPSDDLFFRGGYVPVEQADTNPNSNPNSKPLQSQSRVSLMKSATKLRVMMLKFNKSISKPKLAENTESNEEDKKDPNEDSPVVSLFTRRNSSKPLKKRQSDDESEKKFSKETMQRYLRKVKPLYVRVSKRYGEKLKLAGNVSLPAAEEHEQAPGTTNPKIENETISEASEPPLLASNVKLLKQGNLPAGLRVVCKHLRASRSAFTTVAAAATPVIISSNRRDDSLIQQQDGIQSAILHCKRSFKASRDSDSSSSSGSETVVPYGKCENRSTSSDVDPEEINKTKGDEKGGK